MNSVPIDENMKIHAKCLGFHPIVVEILTSKAHMSLRCHKMDQFSKSSDITHRTKIYITAFGAREKNKHLVIDVSAWSKVMDRYCHPLSC